MRFHESIDKRLVVVVPQVSNKIPYSVYQTLLSRYTEAAVYYFVQRYGWSVFEFEHKLMLLLD